MAARQQLTDLRPQLTALEAEDAQGKQLLDEEALLEALQYRAQEKVETF